MKIWLQKHTVEGRLPLLDETYRRHVAKVLGEGAEVHVAGLPRETYEALLPAGHVRYGSAEAMFSWYFGAQALVAERAGYDAYVIGASTDPGIEAARAIAQIPVLGFGETAFFACAQRGLRFGIVGCVSELQVMLRANLRRYGLMDWLVGFGYLHDGPSLVRQALQGEPAAFLAEFRRQAQDMIRLGAQVLIPGEGLPNEVLFANAVAEIDGTPILDGNGLLLTTAEHQLRVAALGVFGLPTSGFQHARLPEAERERLFDLFAPRSITGPQSD